MRNDSQADPGHEPALVFSDGAVRTTRSPTRYRRILACAVLGLSLGLVACSPLSKQLREQIEDGAYQDAITEGTEWLHIHDESPYDPIERERVDLLVAEAQLNRVSKADEVGEYRWFRRTYGGNPKYSTLMTRCTERESEAAWRDEATIADDRLGYQRFSETYPRSKWLPEAHKREMQRAFADSLDTVEAQQTFRQQFQGYEGFDVLEGASREREVRAAFGVAQLVGDLVAWQHFRQTYADWSEAETLRAQAFELEAERALSDATATQDLSRLEAVRATYATEPWIERTDRAIAAVVTTPLVGATRAGSVLGDEQIDAFFAAHRARPFLAAATAPHQGRIRSLALDSGRAGPLRLYRLLYPSDPEAPSLLKTETDRAWHEAEMADRMEGWALFVDAYAHDPRVDEADERYFRQRQLALAEARWPRAQVAWSRKVNAREVELIVDVLDCEGKRISGLTRDAFEIYAGGMPQAITDFKGLEDERPLDVMFAIDMSGSMDVERRAVQEAVSHFAETFRYRGRDMRVGLLTFADQIIQRHAPVGNVDQFIKWMQALPATASGLSEDSVYAWVSASDQLKNSKAERVAILLTDEDLQMNRGGRRALKLDQNNEAGACARMMQAALCIGRCADARCLARCYGMVGPSQKKAMDRCVQRAGPNLCTAAADWRRTFQALQNCVEPIDDDSPVVGLLADRLRATRLRPYFIIPPTDQLGEHPIKGHQELARQAQGRVLPVPHDTDDAAPYTAALDDIADQLSKQYQIRFAQIAPGVTAVPTVVAHRQHQWNGVLPLPAGSLMALVPLSARSDCLDLMLVLDAGAYRTEACGARWRRLDPSGPARSWVQAAWHGDRVVLRDRRQLVDISMKDEEFRAIDLEGNTPLDVVFDPKGGLWALASAAADEHIILHQTTSGAPLAVRDRHREPTSDTDAIDAESADPETADPETADPETADPETAARVRNAIGVPQDGEHRPGLFLTGYDLAHRLSICTMTRPDQRRCSVDEGGTWHTFPSIGLPPRAMVGGKSSALSVPGRPGTALIATSDGALWRTLDLGANWRQVLPPAPPRDSPAASADVAAPTLTWWSGSEPAVCLSTHDDVRCSRDHGRSWTGLERLRQDVVAVEGHALTEPQVLAGIGADLYLGRRGELKRLDRIISRDIPSSAVYFTTDSDQFSASLSPFLTEVARRMLHDETLALSVEGHADRRGSDEHNDDLALRRAQSVAHAIVADGIASHRVEVRGYGSRRPVRPGTRPDDLARNRRVELVLTQRVPAETPERDECGRPVTSR